MASDKNKFGRLPGDLTQNEMVERMIRVNHAGEYGAKRIYEGQLSVLTDTKEGEVIREMEMAERRHLEKFSELIVKRRVRPTVLSPLWHVAGYALGFATAKLGKEAAMACTVAVEEVIEEPDVIGGAELTRDSEQCGLILRSPIAPASSTQVVRLGCNKTHCTVAQ